MAAGVLYGIIALIVMQSGVGWVERLMPAGSDRCRRRGHRNNLAPVAVKAVSGSQFDACIGLITVVIVGLVAHRLPGVGGALPVIIGAVAGYVLYLLLANVAGWRKPVDYTALAVVPRDWTPKFHRSLVSHECRFFRLRRWQSFWWLKISGTSRRSAQLTGRVSTRF